MMIIFISHVLLSLLLVRPAYEDEIEQPMI
jgi:hypothetical protein